MRAEAMQCVGVSSAGVFYIGLSNCWAPRLSATVISFLLEDGEEMVTMVGWDLIKPMASPSDRPLKRRMEPVWSPFTAVLGPAFPPPLSCLLARVGWGGKKIRSGLNPSLLHFLAG